MRCNDYSTKNNELKGLTKPIQCNYPGCYYPKLTPVKCSKYPNTFLHHEYQAELEDNKGMDSEAMINQCYKCHQHHQEERVWGPTFGPDPPRSTTCNYPECKLHLLRPDPCTLCKEKALHPMCQTQAKAARGITDDNKTKKCYVYNGAVNVLLNSSDDDDSSSEGESSDDEDQERN